MMRSKQKRGHPDLSIEAELLHPFVSSTDVIFEKWIVMVQKRFFLLKRDPEMKMGVMSNGSLRLSTQFARHFALMAQTTLKGAVALRLIDEAAQNEFRWMTDQPNRDLRRFRGLALSRHWVDGLSLHDFLQAESAYTTWVDHLKGSQGMEYGRDCLRIIDTNQGASEISPQDTGLGWLYFSTEFAKKVAMAEPTPRGVAIGQLMRADPISCPTLWGL